MKCQLIKHINSTSINHEVAIIITVFGRLLVIAGRGGGEIQLAEAIRGAPGVRASVHPRSSPSTIYCHYFSKLPAHAEDILITLKFSQLAIIRILISLDILYGYYLSFYYMAVYII